MLQPLLHQKLSRPVHLDIRINFHSNHFSLLVEMGVAKKCGEKLRRPWNSRCCDHLKFSARILQAVNCSLIVGSLLENVWDCSRAQFAIRLLWFSFTFTIRKSTALDFSHCAQHTGWWWTVERWMDKANGLFSLSLFFFFILLVLHKR